MSQKTSKPGILVLGATGNIGKEVIKALDALNAAQRTNIVLASRNDQQVVSWEAEGRQAVLLDLDNPHTFAPALKNIDRIFLLTGYTVDMIHQSKTLVDAAKNAGVEFIVHLGIFGDGKTTEPHFTWHEMIECYIEASGIAWCHLHPNVFLETGVKSAPVINGVLHSFIGDKKVGWIAIEDIAAVAALVLTEGPARHAGKNYYLSTESLGASEITAILSRVTGRQLTFQPLAPQALIDGVLSGQLSLPDYMEGTYAKSTLKFLQQVYDGTMAYVADTTTTLSELTGRPGIRMEDWAVTHLDHFILS